MAQRHRLWRQSSWQTVSVDLTTAVLSLALRPLLTLVLSLVLAPVSLVLSRSFADSRSVFHSRGFPGRCTCPQWRYRRRTRALLPLYSQREELMSAQQYGRQI